MRAMSGRWAEPTRLELWDFKQSVRAASTANLTLSGAQTIDGVSVVAGDRVLVKDQSAGAENGIYVAAAGAWARAADADTSAEVTSGLYVWVEEGTANGDSGWYLATNATITLGSTALTFVQISGAGQVIDGNGLTKSGNTLHVGAGTGISVGADAVAVDQTFSPTWTGNHVFSNDIIHGATTAKVAVGHVTSGSDFPGLWLGNIATRDLTNYHLLLDAANALILNTTNNLRFQVSGTTKWELNSSGHLVTAGSEDKDIGAAGTTRPRNVFLAGRVEGTEVTAPGVAPANGWRLYGEDNGAGKTRLMVIFQSGAAQQLALEP